MSTSSQVTDYRQPSAPSFNIPGLARAFPPLQINPVSKVGFWLAAVWVFVSFSRFFDLVASGYKIPGVVYYAMLGTVLVSGAIPRSLSHRMTLIIAAFTLWVGITLPFSVWRTNSLDPARGAFQSLVTFVAVSGLTLSGRQCIRMMYALGFAAFISAALGFVYGNMETGRLELANGSFKDPNEYAMVLLMGIPLLALMARSASPFLRVAGVGCVLVTFYAFMRAGSRGGMIALVVVAFMLFWEVALSKKVLVLVAVGALVAFATVALPDYLRQRYFTFFAVDESSPMNAAERQMLQGVDVASSEGRLMLLYGSLRLTAEHPLFGVGPGNFPTAYWSEAKENGKRVAWNVSHNTYTQISSETGIPGALLFIAFLVTAFRAARRVIKHGAANGYPELARAGYHLWLSLAGAAVASFFLSLAYYPALYVLGALALSLERAISRPRAVMAGPPAPAAITRVPAPAPTVFHPPASLGRKIMSGKAVRALMRKV